MSDDPASSLDADDYEVIPAAGGRFIVRVGCVCAELSLDELVRLRQVLTAVADHFNAVLWKLGPRDVAH